jgi:membrane associated rhomboid family serine protease
MMKDHRQIRVYAGKKRNFFSKLNCTTILIIINVAFFLIVSPFLALYPEATTKYIALQPLAFFHGQYLWTIVTSMFMHANLIHLSINMFVLFSLGGLCEKIIGKKRFVAFYIISGIIAGLVYVSLAYSFGTTPLGARIFASPDTFAVGASGAIFAIAALFMILTPKLKFAIIFLPFFSLPAYIMIPIVLFVTWAVSSSVGLGVGNTAHLGGFLAGIVYGLYLRNKYKKKAKMISDYFS